ncbi:MAG: hypothetical protein EXS36_00110 [Pedosphaera sp.]|nr:hypothetical protein [Pedosphaera sp.]
MIMKFNKWTMALVATGAVSLASAVNADEHPLNTLLSSTSLSGYVDTSAIWNFGTGNSVANRFVNTGPNRQDGFNLNVAKIALEKPLDEGSWSAGYKLETLFGPDAAGLPGNGTLTSGNSFGLKQAYVALRAPVGNGLDFKVGRFDPIIGYEVFDSYANPNFSRSFGYAIEPLTHTGVLVSYKVTDLIGISAGVANTDQSTVARSGNAETKKTYMGGIVLTAPESTGWMAGSSLYGGAVVGVDRNLGHGNSQDLNLYVGGSLTTPIKGLSFGASYDYLDGNSYASAAALYASFQATDQLKLNTRVEYAESGWGAFANTGMRDKVFGVTVTADYALWANVVTRVELRWDQSVNGSDAFFEHYKNGVGVDGEREDVSLLLNIIYRF